MRYYINSTFFETLQDELGALLVFLQHMITWESFIVLLNTFGATYFYIFYNVNGTYLAGRLDFNLLSVAIVFPLTYLCGQTFARREKALDTLAQARSLIINICYSMLYWDFGPYKDGVGSRSRLPHRFPAEVVETCLQLSDHLRIYLTANNVTKLRYETLAPSKLADGWKIQSEVMSNIDICLRKCYKLVEVMKSKGLPANEASRINQYHTLLKSAIEGLRNLKWYRTPHGTRAFGRVYIIMMPWCYGPYFAWVAKRDVNQTSLMTIIFAFVLAHLTSIVLIGLINVQRQMEDPFLSHGIDNVRVERDFEELSMTINAAWSGTIDGEEIVNNTVRSTSMGDVVEGHKDGITSSLIVGITG